MTTPANPVRFCPVCKTADDHPRHDIVGTDPLVAPHMDCCASVGCPDGRCDISIRAKGDKVGEAFSKQITNPTFLAKTRELEAALDEKTGTFTRDDVDPAVHGSFVEGTINLQGAS